MKFSMVFQSSNRIKITVLAVTEKALPASPAPLSNYTIFLFYHEPARHIEL